MTQPFRSLAVVGAGAVGSYYGAMLARAGHAVTLIGRAVHVEAIRRDGLQLRAPGGDQTLRIAATTELGAVRDADLVLVCVKSPDTEATARALAPWLARDALVLSLQNGVDNADTLARHLPQDVVPAVVYVATSLPGPGVVQHFGGGALVIGAREPAAAPPGSALQRRLEALVQLLAGAQVAVQISPDVRVELWSKLLVNCAYNAISALSQQPYGRLVEHAEIRALQQAVVREVVAVAQAEGVALDLDVAQAASARIAELMPGQRSSTAQDLARGKPTEIDHLNGHIVRRARAHGLEVPVNRTLHALVRLAESAGLSGVPGSSAAAAAPPRRRQHRHPLALDTVRTRRCIAPAQRGARSGVQACSGSSPAVAAACEPTPAAPAPKLRFGRAGITVEIRETGMDRAPTDWLNLPWGSAQRLVSATLSRETLALVLAGGRGSRLAELTDKRAKPAVLFGGRFRIIDFTLANCVNSDIRRIAVLTQYKAQSLIRHIQDGWPMSRRFGEFVEIVPAQQRRGDGWYAGTADAVFQNLDLIQQHRPAHVLVLGGDHVYKMDYTALLTEHVANQAEVTVACVEVPLEHAGSFGIVQADAEQRIVGWQEKPAAPQPMPGSRDRALASMGIYVFDAATLVRALGDDARNAGSSHDFGHDVLPQLLREGRRVMAHAFSRSCVRRPGAEPYWRDVGTLDAYWEANLELTRGSAGCDLFDPAWPIPAMRDGAMPSRFRADERGRHGAISDSLTGSGCLIGAATIQRSVLFSDVQVMHGAHIRDSVILSDVVVGANVTLQRTIVDKFCRLPAGLTVGVDPDQDARRFRVTDRGITLITPEMLGQTPAPSRDESRPGPLSSSLAEPAEAGIG